MITYRMDQKDGWAKNGKGYPTVTDAFYERQGWFLYVYREPGELLGVVDIEAALNSGEEPEKPVSTMSDLLAIIRCEADKIISNQTSDLQNPFG